MMKVKRFLPHLMIDLLVLGTLVYFNMIMIQKENKFSLFIFMTEIIQLILEQELYELGC